MIPAVGQGAIALQCREGEEERFRDLTDPATDQAVRIEREFLSMVEGGCQTAFAAHFIENSLLAFHEDAGRFSLSFNSLNMDDVREAIRITLGDIQS